jgi:two-component system, OmpR family, response regulator
MGLDRHRIAAKDQRLGSVATLPVRCDKVTDGISDMNHVLVVDDDADLREVIANYFEAQNIPIRSASNRYEFSRLFAASRPCLIVLDLHLGRDDGLELLRSIRSQSDVPVIIITGSRPDDADCVVGLELGADDYIAKPFSLRELLARVRAVLRRQEMGRAGRARDTDRGSYRFAGWRLERRSRQLVDPGGTSVALSKGEYALLLAFLESPQRPLSREQLLQATRIREDVFDRSIDIQVLRLRRKLDAGMIQTERGVGYTFAQPVERF